MCAHLVLLVNPQFSVAVVWASAPQVIRSFPPSKGFGTPVYKSPAADRCRGDDPEHSGNLERIQDQILVIIKVGPQERVQQRTFEQIGDVPVPQSQEQIEEVVIVIP